MARVTMSRALLGALGGGVGLMGLVVGWAVGPSSSAEPEPLSSVAVTTTMATSSTVVVAVARVECRVKGANLPQQTWAFVAGIEEAGTGELAAALGRNDAVVPKREEINDDAGLATFQSKLDGVGVLVVQAGERQKKLARELASGSLVVAVLPQQHARSLEDFPDGTVGVFIDGVVNQDDARLSDDAANFIKHIIEGGGQCPAAEGGQSS